MCCCTTRCGTEARSARRPTSDQSDASIGYTPPELFMCFDSLKLSLSMSHYIPVRVLFSTALSHFRKQGATSYFNACYLAQTKEYLVTQFLDKGDDSILYIYR